VKTLAVVSGKKFESSQTLDSMPEGNLASGYGKELRLD
jgi:hypothetical protein